MYFNFKLIKLFFVLYCLELNWYFCNCCYISVFNIIKDCFVLCYGAECIILLKLKFVNVFTSLDSGIMIKSVFSLVLVELSDLLVFNGI